jgi:hypothetical protein
LTNRSFEIIKDSTFKKGQWEKLSDSDKSMFAQMVSGNSDVDCVKEFLKTRGGVFGAKEAYEASDRYGRFVKSALGGNNPDVFNVDQYKSLENWNLQKRIDSPTTTEEEKKIYQKTQYLLQRDVNGIQKSIENIKQELGRATTSDEKKRLKQELKDAQGALRIIGSHNIFGRIGQVEGYMGQLRDIYGGVSGANLAASILNGSFFDYNQNTIFNPVSEHKNLLVE